MSSVLGEEPVHYHTTSSGVEEMSLSKAEAGMDWEAYDKRMEARLQSAVEGCAAGAGAIPLDEAFENLVRRQQGRRSGSPA